MNYKDCCRTCLGNNKEMRNYQTVVTIAGADVRLADILQQFYNYEITTKDAFPENICINCVYHLTVTYSFKVLIEKSNKTLEKCLTAIDSRSEKFDLDLGQDDHKSSSDFSDKDDNIPLVTKNQVFCVECKTKFNSAASLIEHCTNAHPVKSTVGQDCDYCNEKFENFESLIKHMKLHLKPYECDNCWEGFFNYTDLKTHRCRSNRKKKDQNKPLQQCEQCGKSYPSGYIKLHVRIHGNDEPYSCKYRPKKFKVRCNLNSHVLWKHKKTKNHTCHICNARFVSHSSRSAHIRKQHFNERNHICVTCGKNFFQKCDMERHYLTHTGVKNFHCKMCDKSYQTRYGLNVHLKSHSHVQCTPKIDKAPSCNNLM